MQTSLENTSILKKVHTLTERLQRAVDMHSYLLTSTFELPKLSQTLSSTLDDSWKQMSELDRDKLCDEQSLNPPSQPLEPTHVIEFSRKQSRRQYSWPSREVDAFEEGGCVVDIVPRMKALESTAALSLATFTSLLIEFIARLDHLVEAVDDLSRLAKFKSEIL